MSTNVSEAARVVKQYVLSTTAKQQATDKKAARLWASTVQLGHVIVAGTGEIDAFSLWVPMALRERGMRLVELPGGNACFEVVPHLSTFKE